MKKFVFFVFFFSILSAIALELPKDPHVFYGTVKLNNNAVSGVLKLYVNDVYQDQISVVNGKFGGSGVFDSKLTATGKNGDNITFELIVNCYSTNKITKTYQEGKVEEITLSFTGTYTCKKEPTTTLPSEFPQELPQPESDFKKEIFNLLKDQTKNDELLKEIIETYENIFKLLTEDKIKNTLVIEDPSKIPDISDYRIDFVLQIPIQDLTIKESTILTREIENKVLSGLFREFGTNYKIDPLSVRTRATLFLGKGDLRDVILLKYEIITSEKTVVMYIPKTVAESTDFLIGNFTVIEKDPIILFENQAKIELLINVKSASELQQKIKDLSAIVITKLAEVQKQPEIKPPEQPKPPSKEEPQQPQVTEEKPQEEIPQISKQVEEKPKIWLYLIIAVIIALLLILAATMLKKSKTKQ
ncbi:MAG: hypothetical protein QXS41_03780 [Candidatus Woesearchaeota archaeon]